jgi:hypothetical protein
MAENLAILTRNSTKNIYRTLKAKGVDQEILDGLDVNMDSDDKSLISLPDEETHCPRSPTPVPDLAPAFQKMLGDFTSVIQSLKRPVSPFKELESSLGKKLEAACHPEVDLDTSQVFDLAVAKEVDML